MVKLIRIWSRCTFSTNCSSNAVLICLFSTLSTSPLICLQASPGPNASTALLTQDWPWCSFDSEVLSCFSQLMVTASLLFYLLLCSFLLCCSTVSLNNHQLLLYPTDTTGGKVTWELDAHTPIMCIPPKNSTNHSYSTSVRFFL